MKIKSTLTGTATLITFPNSPERLLLVDVAIDCPGCGQHQVRFAGHHLRALRNLLIGVIDLHPDLCGDESGIEVVKRMTFEGTPPQNPESN